MTLKPFHCRIFNLSGEYIDELNIEMLINCLQQGRHLPHQGTLMVYCLDTRRLDTNKPSYDCLPKVFKYKTSEYSFKNYVFNYDAFYDHLTDLVQIKIDYCEYILRNYPSAKRPLKFYRKLKLNHAEYFV